MKMAIPVAIVLVGLVQAQNNQTPATANSQVDRNQNVSQSATDRIVKEVHHELVLLPYGVFDNLAYRVSPDGTVTLLGQVARPTLKPHHTGALTCQL